MKIVSLSKTTYFMGTEGVKGTEGVVEWRTKPVADVRISSIAESGRALGQPVPWTMDLGIDWTTLQNPDDSYLRGAWILCGGDSVTLFV